MIAKLKAAFDQIAGVSDDIEAEDLLNILNRAFKDKCTFIGSEVGLAGLLLVRESTNQWGSFFSF